MDGPTDPLAGREVVFATPWFKVLAEQPSGSTKPHYAITGNDFVVVVAVTAKSELLLVRQFRHAVRSVTLELPSGHVDPGESPEQAARRELLEETGYEAAVFQPLGALSPTVARYTNQFWCFFAADARPVAGVQIQPGEVEELILYKGGVGKLTQEREFYSAPNHAALCLAMARGFLKPPY